MFTSSSGGFTLIEKCCSGVPFVKAGREDGIMASEAVVAVLVSPPARNLNPGVISRIAIDEGHG